MTRFMCQKFFVSTAKFIVLFKYGVPDEKNARNRFYVELTRLIGKNIYMENVSGAPLFCQKI